MDSVTVLAGPEEIIVDRTESGFDRACDMAHAIAVNRFGIDDCGHSTYTNGWERCCSWIEVEFVKYVRVGSSHIYSFCAFAKRNMESD